jgi:hypothetical protein
VALLQPVRFDLWRIGGSHAQRDMVDWTLTEAAFAADCGMSRCRSHTSGWAPVRVAP